MTLLKILVEMNTPDKNIVGIYLLHLAAMEMEAEAEITSGAQVLKSERERQAQIQIDEKKITVILASQAKMMARVNRAQGEIHNLQAIIFL
ncbi:hypothetical protein J5N97_025480 [Dioscorea zingiberensis]|uniref:Uncharacterized protein n=1 Tax=Dioscorea zingiberensis TaxID=325984 RepID=A0A9D5C949_9LILI|nr:hypothetical protein J5N97_025480 [Dioscorea zingiberensis]